MRNYIAIVFACVLCGVGLLAGCGWLLPLDNGPAAASTFLGINLSSFGGSRSIPALNDSPTSDSAVVALPVDLLENAPEDVVIVLSLPDLAVTVDGGSDAPNPQGQTVVHHAIVTFRLAPAGQDACGSGTLIGPFELTIVDGVVTLAIESLPLDKATQAAVRSGRIEICAEIWADFDGHISMGKVSIEFGKLPPGEKRVELCHIPPGDPNSAHNITVGASAVAAHLAHGDYLGECNVGDTGGDGGDGGVSDGDGDGVPDDADACPNTPSGQTIDPNGCSCSQLDEDGDDVSDCDDLCPNTPDGATVDGNGCQVIVADAGADVTLDEVGFVTLQGSASGGTPPYTYAWSAPDWGGSMAQNPTVVPSQTTTYTLTVTDWSFPPQTATDTVTVTVSAHVGRQYTIVNLGANGGHSSFPAGINDAGEVVGYYYTSSWQKRAFLYSGGAMTDLGDLGGGEAYARDINNAGQAVGEARNGDGNWRAFIWDSVGGMRDLGTLGGASSVGYAVNELGQAVGYSDTGSANHAFLYSDGVMTSLGTLDHDQSGAFDINDFGQAVGSRTISGSYTKAFIYDNGTLTDLGSPLLKGSRAWSINNAGLVAGYSWGDGQYRSFLYAGGTVIDLGSLEGLARTYVWGISETNQVVGSSTNQDGSVSHAFVFTGGTLYDLNGLLVPGHGWEYLTAAYAVNSNGQIAGYGRINSQNRAFLVTPVP